MTPEQIDELAALHAAGALDGPDLETFERLLREWDDSACQALASHLSTTAQWIIGLSTPTEPPPELKARLLGKIRRGGSSAPPAAPAPSPAMAAGFRHVLGTDPGGWQQALIPGASIKVLFCNRQEQYAVVLGKLAAGVRYPPHHHVGPEELFVLSGDLHVGEHTLMAGDFHHADAGTDHGENFSVGGCTLLAVVHTSVLADLGVRA